MNRTETLKKLVETAIATGQELEYLIEDNPDLLYATFADTNEVIEIWDEESLVIGETDNIDQNERKLCVYDILKTIKDEGYTYEGNTRWLSQPDSRADYRTGEVEVKTFHINTPEIAEIVEKIVKHYFA